MLLLGLPQGDIGPGRKNRNNQFIKFLHDVHIHRAGRQNGRRHPQGSGSLHNERPFPQASELPRELPPPVVSVLVNDKTSSSVHSYSRLSTRFFFSAGASVREKGEREREREREGERERERVKERES